MNPSVILKKKALEITQQLEEARNAKEEAELTDDFEVATAAAQKAVDANEKAGILIQEAEDTYNRIAPPTLNDNLIFENAQSEAD